MGGGAGTGEGGGGGTGEGGGGGAGEGGGGGAGVGKGRGAGADTSTNVAMGGVCTIVCTVILCCIGVPLLVAGLILLYIVNDFQSMGIAFIAVACLMTLGGIIMVILICTGCCGRTNRRQASSTRTQVVFTTTSPPVQPVQHPQYTQQPPAYPQYASPTAPGPQQYYPPGPHPAPDFTNDAPPSYNEAVQASAPQMN